MEAKEALNILSQGVDIALKKGAFGRKDAQLVLGALGSLERILAVPDQKTETIEVEQEG